MNNVIAYFHEPVLLSEVLDFLNPQPGQNFVDATLGGGGYSRAILERISPDGSLLAIDLDEEAIENFKVQISNFKKPKNQNIILHHGNFRDINKIVQHHNFKNIAGMVADIGLSSYQLDQAGRGLSFQKDEILDMRFDKRGDGADAKFILNNYDEKQLYKIFNDYGEEKFARQIARKIKDLRFKIKEIKHTGELYKVIEEALPKPVKHRAADSARRVFQALRIEVNHELQNLEDFLPKAFDILAPGGRLVVISFHSLEDRIVKQYFLKLEKGCVCPPEFPYCVCGKNPQGKILTKKPVTSAEEEIKQNPRSKPAKLRAIVKL